MIFNNTYNQVRLHHNPTTGERGVQIRMTNATGAPSVKGTVLCPSTTTNNAVQLETGGYDAIAICDENGIADNEPMWCWTHGSVCQVLLADTQSAQRRNLILASDIVDGRAESVSPPPPPPNDSDHFREIGHALQTVTPGTDVLCLIQFHTN